MRDLFKDMSVCRGAIVEKHKACMDDERCPSESIRDTIECPICKEGTIHYSIASVNGHIHAKCTTGDCISWME